MAEQQEQTTQLQFLLSDFNTRLKDSEERNRAIRERVLLLGKNLITSKEDTEKEIETLKKQTNKLQTDIDKIKSLSKNIIAEINKYARKDETMVIERMLKDFQPLEFMRKKDVEELIDEKLGKKTNKKEKKLVIKKPQIK